MVTSIKVRLNTARCNKEKMYPLVFQLLKGGSKRLIPTGIFLKKEWFNSRTEQVTIIPRQYGGRVRRKEVTQLLYTMRKEIENMVTLMNRKDKNCTIASIAMAYRESKDSCYLSTFIAAEYKQLELTGRFNTRERYQSLYNSVVRYCKDCGRSAIVELDDIDESFVISYRGFLEREGLKSSSIIAYLSLLRKLYNKACKMNIISSKGSIFRGNIPHAEPSEKRAADAGLLRLIREVQLDAFPELISSRDVFLASLYMEGMAVRDIMNLRKENLRNGVIFYRRSKTGKLLTVKVVPELRKILDKYGSEDSYLFPFLLSDRHHSYKDYRNALRRLNRHLGKLEVLLKLPLHLTTYVARHSWASIAQICNFPIEQISQALGHSSTKTTQIYLKEFNHAVIDKINEQVINCFGNEEPKVYISY